MGSPGDLAEERQAAKAVVDGVNGVANHLGYQLELVGWEDTPSKFGRPQATINQELERCDYFLGLMWERWGTPPDISGKFTSGFEEEYELSIARRKKEGRPEIGMHFKAIEQRRINDPGEELRKVIAFRSKLISEKQLLFNEFSTLREFEDRIRTNLTEYIFSLRKSSIQESTTDVLKAPETEGDDTRNIEDNNPSPFSDVGLKFLRGLISKAKKNEKDNLVTPVEVARFRLLSTYIGNHENDDRVLGVHDANLLFVKGQDFEFDGREINSLIACGLDSYVSKTAPLWKWLGFRDGFRRGSLAIYSLIGTDERRLAALHAMKLISEPIANVNAIERKFFIKTWFSEESSISLKVAAVDYLAKCGTTIDIKTLSDLLANSDNALVAAASRAIISLSFRDSRSGALKMLYEIQPTVVDDETLDQLFSNPEALSDEVLLKGIDNRSERVRRRVIELLLARGGLTIEIADQLVVDSDVLVRSLAVEFLIDKGRLFSDDELKKLFPYEAHSALNILSSVTPSGDDLRNKIQFKILRRLGKAELQKRIAEEWVFSRNAYFVYVVKYFSEHSAELRAAVDDRFKSEFSRLLGEMTDHVGMDTLIEKTRKLENGLRKDYLRQAINIICIHSKKQDIERVRSVLRSKDVDYAKEDIEYLERWGEWDDISLIAFLIQEGSPVHWRENNRGVAAKAVIALGKDRIAEVVDLLNASSLLVHVIAKISDREFKNFTQAVLDSLLRHINDDVREVTALRCIKQKSKNDLIEIQKAYVRADQYYYNVSHWLDMGISVPRTRAVAASGEWIKNRWQ